MQTISYSTFRSNLSSVMDSVNDDHKPVLISVEDFESYQETAYLMQSPNNAQRLNDAMADIEAGKTLSHGLIEE
jgi:antitoxin YefM